MRYQYGPMAAVALLRFALAIADVDPGLSARLMVRPTEQILGSRVYESWAEGMRGDALERHGRGSARSRRPS